MAFSPDGKWLYLTGYRWLHTTGGGTPRVIWTHGVLRMRFEGDAEPEAFLGSMKEDGFGSDNAHFKIPTSVACDSRGRVYVADYLNDRIQVFLPDGRFYKTVKIQKPSHVAIHHDTDELYVFSWHLRNDYLKAGTKVPARFTKLGRLEDPRVVASYPLPLRDYRQNRFGAYVTTGVDYHVAFDSWAKQPTIWLVPRKPGSIYGSVERIEATWASSGILLLVPKQGKLVLKRDFGQEARRAVVKLRYSQPEDNQRIYANPKTGLVYVTGRLGGGEYKGFVDLLEIDPRTGKCRTIPLPFVTFDICFDAAGHVYLQGGGYVARYDIKTWRAVPWDYGVELKDQISVLQYPGTSGGYQGGIAVSLKGHVVVATNHYPQFGSFVKRTDVKRTGAALVGRKYQPPLYPGRVVSGRILHVWVKHGKVVYVDAVPGLNYASQVRIDNEDNLYLISSNARLRDGELPFNDISGALMKFKPGKGRIVSRSKFAPIPLKDDSRPKRPADLKGADLRTAWVEGAEWLHGGVGRFGSRGKGVYGGHCTCKSVRFALDYFRRSFAPETDRYSVIVLDANGNRIVRLGTYGNVDDGRPLDLAGGPSKPRSIGAGEVALFNGSYLATHTDRRLFIYDHGNARVLSVKLGYHREQRIALKDVPDEAGR
ncbi:hypothetical protein LCGC14_1891010, partial [marine sediment metagenome]